MTDSIKDYIFMKSEKKEVKRASTGCTLLDLVVGGGEGLGIPFGKIINIVGDKSSGKTFLLNEIIAASYAEYKDNLSWNLDDGEAGYTFDPVKLYGIDIIGGSVYQSKTIQDFDAHVGVFLKNIKGKNKVGIYGLDSLDGLSDEEKEKRAGDRTSAMEKGKGHEDKGTYGMQLPKFLSQEFFKTKSKQIAEKNTLLVIVSQVRDNIDAFSFKKQTRSGGRALDFYAHTCLWLATVMKIIKNNKVVGVVVKAKTEKSKTARPFRECIFSLYFDYGVDDIGSNIDYLYGLRTDGGKLAKAANSISWGGRDKNLKNLVEVLKQINEYDRCKETKKKETGAGNLSLDYINEWLERVGNVKVKEKIEKTFGSIYTRDELILKIESNKKLEKELKEKVIAKWEAEEAAIATNRKGKYR